MIPKPEFSTRGAAAKDAKEWQQSKGSYLKEEDSNSDTQSSDLEFVEAEAGTSPGSKASLTQERIDSGVDQQVQAPTNGDLQLKEKKDSHSPRNESESSQADSQNMSGQRAAPLLQLPGLAGLQPRRDLVLDRTKTGQAALSPPK